MQDDLPSAPEALRLFFGSILKEDEMALHHVKSGEIVDLRPLGGELRNAHTTALVKSDSFEAVRLIVQAGTSIPSHHVEGRFTLHCLEGRVRLGLAQGSMELSGGQWVYFDGGITHSVEGIEDSSLLLTILFDHLRSTAESQ